MTKIKSLLLVFFLFFQSGYLYANDNIVYMDFNYVINNSNIGKKVLDELNKQNKKNIENLKSYQTKLKQEIDEINKIRNIATQEDIKKKISEHNEKAKEYDKLKIKLSNELNKRRNDEMNRLVNLINPLLENYMKENSIDIVLNKEIVYFAKEQYDISKDILEITNNNLK
jgi:Skp family chaperone for outer membrane proteins